MKRIASLLFFLMACMQLMAAQSRLDSLRHMLEQAPVQEKVYIHMDNTCYFKGDTVWYKAYVVRADNNQYTDMSRLMYVELVSPDGLVVERQQLIVSEKGYSSGDFALKDSLYSGFYELRAYTRWMLNFCVTEHPYGRKDREQFYNHQMAADFFRQYGTIYSRVFPVYERPDSTGDFSQKYIVSRPKQRLDKVLKPDLNVRFYPEGGNLVAGTQCRIAFEATTEEGEAVSDLQLQIGSQTARTEYMGRGALEMEIPEDSTRLWHIASYNGLETEEQLGDTLVRRQVIDSNGYLSELSLRKGNVLLRGLTHEYNPLTGNLTSREGMGGGILEEYTYDGTDRLTRYSIDSQDVLTISYEPNGNISSKTGVGTYTYNSGAPLPYAVQSVTNSASMIPSSALTSEYNGFGKVTSIEDFHTMKRHEITYGPDLSRWVSENYTGNSMNSDRTYLGDLEISTYGPGEAVYFYYLDGGVVLMGTGGSQVTPYYLCTDHQGSVLNIYDGNGQEVFAATYDPWGGQAVTRNDIGFYRGYCGHEMITEFNLINMNGRIYDPVLGRFISPDNYVQEPENPQNYNRYSYCMNNPVKYTDPSGNSWISSHWKSIVSSAVAISVSAVTAGAGGGIILAGMAGGAAGGLTSSVLYGNNFETALQSACIGATMGGLSAGLNNAAASPNLATSILRHAGVNAMLTAVQGGDVAQGALMGGFSALSNNLLNTYAQDLGSSGLVAASALSGGILSSITGGDFAQGAITGAYGMIFNEMMHDLYKRDRLFHATNALKRNIRSWRSVVRKRAYNFMIRRTKQTGNEVAAAVLENGDVLVYRDRKSTPNSSWNHFSTRNGKTYVRIGKSDEAVTFQVHTHPHYGDVSNPFAISSQDINMAQTHFNGIIHVLFLDGKLYEVYTNTPGFQERKW